MVGYVKSCSAVYPAVEVTMYSIVVLLVAEKKWLVWDRPRELQVPFLLLEGIFQRREEQFLLSALAIDE